MDLKKTFFHGKHFIFFKIFERLPWISLNTQFFKKKIHAYFFAWIVVIAIYFLKRWAECLLAISVNLRSDFGEHFLVRILLGSLTNPQ